MCRVAETFNAFTNSDLQGQFREWIALEFPKLGVGLSKNKHLVKTVRGTERIPLKTKRLRAAQYESA